jgi:ABC-type Na+ efflux pump permease subunit
MLVVADSSAEPMTPLLFLVWIVAGLMVSAQAASLIAGERSHQTLEVLCTTPLTGGEILHQKFRAVRRLMLVLAVSFATIFIFESAMKWNMPDRWAMYNTSRRFELPLYLACSALSVGIYLPFFAWLSFLIGLKVRTQARAIAGSMAVLVGWSVLPLVFIDLPLTILFRGTASVPYVARLATLSSPLSIIMANENSFRQEFTAAPWVAVILNFLGYGLLLLLVRGLCLRNVDRLLGRSECKLPQVDYDLVMASVANPPPHPAAASPEG